MTMITIEGEIKNLTRVWLAVIASLCYCRFISARLPRGKWRLISLVPIFYVFIIIPLYTTCAFSTAVTAFFIAWLANFKLLLFCLRSGPYCNWPPQNLSPFSLPWLPSHSRLSPNTTPQLPKSPRNCLSSYLATEIPISAVLISILYDYKEYIHPHIVLVAYCCLFFLLIDNIIELSSLLVHALLGQELEPPSDEPYLSTSIQEFWGRRWNLTVNSMLRQTVYKPVRSAAAPVAGRDWAALPAVLVAFLVSGLMHELIVWYVTRARPWWEMTMYFVVQGICIVAEFGFKVALSEKKWRRLPWLVSWLLTVGFVVGTSFWLFFPPLTIKERCGYEGNWRITICSGGCEGEAEGTWLHMGNRWGWSSIATKFN